MPSLRRSHKFLGPEYSVEIQPIFRREWQIVYRERSRIFDFGAEVVGPKWTQVNAMAPEGVEEGELKRIVQNIATVLRQQGYEYVFWKRGEKQVFSESERETAKTRLREMGFEATVAPGGEQVKLAKSPGATHRTNKFTPADSIEVSRCVMILRGYRYLPKILARSDAAVVDFV